MNMPPHSTGFDTRQLRRAFGRAASRYQTAAVLQHEVESRLLEQLDYLQATPQRVVDLGAGPGNASRVMRQRWPKAELLALDMAVPMLREAGRDWRWYTPARKRFDRICADARALPLLDHSVDLVFSSLCLQWVEDLPSVLDGLRRVLRPGGLLLFSTFGPASLQELREAFAAVDGEPHVSGFAPIQSVGDALMSAGFRNPVLDSDRFELTYPDVPALMHELRAIGASNAQQDRRRTLTGKQRMQRVFEAYPANVDARYSATYEVIYAHAWGPEPGQPMRLQGGGEIASFPAGRIPIRRRWPV
ncbi:MAG: Malonyl-(acyl-carrier protein) O-methyltransferase [Alphaproteobacteria bacterium ADurb.BinA280]|jgi:malonyl-CoA O-methyltransferase|nr:MAG: Malonyl-(acyl-carrier protein) O-methyltransferase [Alphaproteobacteria bacterium ADurb.BinA280]